MTALLDELAMLPPGEDAAVLASVSDDDLRSLLYGWAGVRARPEQLPPAWDWRVWLVLAGRGFGKTRTGAEMVRQWVQRYPLVNLIGATADDVRQIMVEGESGLLNICAPHERPTYKPAARTLFWPNGAKSLLFTADEPERLRGKQHMKLWCDEVASWRYIGAWDQAMLGLRLGDNPQAVVTTTPRPIPLLYTLLADATTAVTRGTTYDNRANLAPAFYAEIIKRYEGTRLGRQELNAELLKDNPGALWQREALDAGRVTQVPPLVRLVVGVDPEAVSTDDGAQTGIVVVGKGADGHGYVLDDRSVRTTPHGWATAAVAAYHTHHANLLVAETNQGGEMVQHTIRSVDATIPYKGVHASKSKQARAEPIAALYEQGRFHHVGTFGALEDQQCEWVPGTGPSPDRLDALVWAATELFIGGAEVWAI